MNISEIEMQLSDLVEEPFDRNEFVFKFMTIFNPPKATLTRLQKAARDKLDPGGDLLWPRKMHFRVADLGQAVNIVDALKDQKIAKNKKPRFIIATDGEEFSALDTKIDETLHCDIGKLNDHFDFFLPLAGIDKYEAIEESAADIKAAGRLAKFHDEIIRHNPNWQTPEKRHALNQFMTRILFCLFSEDTGSIEKDIFIKTITEFGGDDGEQLKSLLKQIFDVMNVPENRRGDIPAHIRAFPYVNGGLFADQTEVPAFSKRAKRVLIEAARLDWREINPDIFGSMIQAVVDDSMRGDLGLHYTSVPNIMKVLQPLFLMSLEDEFESMHGHREEHSMLRKLLSRISKIRVFDPACGSGNFLIIAYRELRKLEMRIFQREDELNEGQSEHRWESGIKLSNFYGIELADFAAETAKLSLWIAEYQMNQQFKHLFGEAPPDFPLKEGGHIVRGNAATINWEHVCQRVPDTETYLLGNPPYVWSGDQNKEQKSELKHNFSGEVKSFKILDYVSIWFKKAADYCKNTQAEFAFVSTNSICQGEQAGILWPILFGRGLEIGFAHQSFKWRNLATKNAVVSCVIVNLRNPSIKKKVLFTSDHSRIVSNIGPYLIEMGHFVVKKSIVPLFSQPEMVRGNMPYDGGYLILSPVEKNALEQSHPESHVFLKRLYGSQEVIKGIERWCLWIEDEHLHNAMAIGPIADRIEEVRIKRLSNKDDSVVKLAERPHQFREMNSPKDFAIVIPAVSSEGREILPCVLLGADSAVTNRCYQILDPSPALFSVIVSRMHYVWADTVGGKLETRFNYSNTIIYNNFPLPNFTDNQKQALEDRAWDIIAARDAHPGKTIAWLYDPKTIPDNLLAAHKALDDTLEKIYIGRPFKNDTERLEHLFKLYAEMTAKKNKEAANA